MTKMDATKVQVKFYATEKVDAPLEPYIRVFHRFIQENSLGEMVFDVADYTHVPKGTGVLLVGHGSDYSIDQSEGRVGLLYSRKRDLPDGAALVHDALTRALEAKALLDQVALDAPRAFGTKEVLFRFPDRLHLKNDDASFEKAKPAIEAALKELLLGASYKLSREGEPREPLTIRAKA
jgi:hypothetical protein